MSRYAHMVRCREMVTSADSACPRRVLIFGGPANPAVTVQALIQLVALHVGVCESVTFQLLRSAVWARVAVLREHAVMGRVGDPGEQTQVGAFCDEHIPAVVFLHDLPCSSIAGHAVDPQVEALMFDLCADPGLLHQIVELP